MQTTLRAGHSRTTCAENSALEITKQKFSLDVSLPSLQTTDSGHYSVNVALRKSNPFRVRQCVRGTSDGKSRDSLLELGSLLCQHSAEEEQSLSRMPVCPWHSNDRCNVESQRSICAAQIIMAHGRMRQSAWTEPVRLDASLGALNHPLPLSGVGMQTKQTGHRTRRGCC